MKKILSLTILTLGTLAMSSCQKNPSNAGNLPIKPTEVNTLAYQVTTSLGALGDLSHPSALRTKNRISDETKNTIKSLLPTIDRLLENNSDFSSEILVSDREGYEFKQTIAFVDITEQKISYDLFYNITSKHIEEDSDDDRKLLLNDASTSIPALSEESTSIADSVPATSLPEEYEEEVKIEGIAVIGEETFNFRGETEFEIEEDETEKEMKLQIFASQDDYVKVSQEISIENNEYEEEFQYSVVKDGKLSLSYSIEKEQENQVNEKEVKLVLDGVKYKFEIYNRDQDQFIKVKVENSTEDGKVTFKKVMVTDDTTGEITVDYLEVTE